MSLCGNIDAIMGQGMMISKVKISAEGFEKVEITAKMAEVLGLPKKAVGKWAVVSTDYFEHRLRKVRLDGYFADDKYNNHQRIPNRIWDEMFGSKRSAKFEISKQTIRKQNWVYGLLEQLLKIEELKNVLNVMGRDEVILQILNDTDSSREGGKLYSSTSTAIAHWKYKYRRAYK